MYVLGVATKKGVYDIVAYVWRWHFTTKVADSYYESGSSKYRQYIQLPDTTELNNLIAHKLWGTNSQKKRPEKMDPDKHAMVLLLMIL